MLVVEISMNKERQIGRLLAQRKTDVYPSQLRRKTLMCDYHVRYEREGDKPIEFDMRHDYQKKAEELIIKALREVRRIQRKNKGG